MPSPQQNSDALMSAVSQAIDAEGYEVVFSSDDEGVLLLSAHRDDLRAVVPYGPHESVLSAFDKLALTRAAEAEGMAVPRTVEPTPQVMASWRGPVVVKPTLTFTGQDSGRLDTSVLDDPAGVPACVEEIRRAGGRPILQEVVNGDLCAMTVLSDQDSRIVASTQQRAELTWPPRVGVSARAVTVPLDETLSAQVAALVRRLKWFGLAQLQFLVDGEGNFKLLDFNGRFYGSLALAVSAGVNFPALWALLATHRPLPPIAPPVIGRRYQWFSRDLRASVEQSGGRPLRGARDSLAVSLGSTHSVWQMTDPWPAIHHYGGRLMRRGLERVHSR
jgi:predicted ATP-grasp superfamily ATP-dependent carboligase